MAQDSLTNLLEFLEYGTKLHISVVFLQHYGNKYTYLPFVRRIHENPVCNHNKETLRNKCIRCRDTVLMMVTRHKRSFSGLCPQGVYEYVRPVVRDGVVLAVIFVGNIFNGSDEQRRRLRQHIRPALLKTMQENFPQESCERTADLVESYILYLLDRYGDTTRHPYDVLIENITTYIDENLMYDFSIENMAAIFNYNEKYLGRLFKAKTGKTIKEYCNDQKIKKAKLLLKRTDQHIADIAGQVGFNNVTYFNRIFKRHTGVTPLDYRIKKESGM